MKLNPFFWNLFKKWGLFALSSGLIALTAFLWFGKKSKQLETDYITAQTVWQKWSKTSKIDEAEFNALTKIIAHHKGLAPLYEPKMARKLLKAKQPKTARPYVERTLTRTHLHPYYKEYAETSLTISEEHFAKALEEALALEEKMVSDQNFLKQIGKTQALGSRLFATNSLRIALLYQKLEESGLELKAWETFERHCKTKRFEASFKELISHLTIQNQSLLNYISFRKESLRGSLEIS